MPRRMAEGIELLADPTRRTIVALVAGRVQRPSDIAASVGLSRPAVSRQLHLLTEARLLRCPTRLQNARSRSRAGPSGQGAAP